MTSPEHPITRTELREELDRTLTHYATKEHLERIFSRLLMALGVATGAIITAQKFWN